jgi:5'-3' exoribonuclease 1
MGIPFYFGEIIAKSPQSKKIVVDKCPPHCARFYLDFNSIIHPCSAKVVARLQKQEEVTDRLYNMIFTNIAEYTMKLVDIAKPTQLLYIAVDGVAPRAKMHQQRKRRYLSAQRNKHIATFKSRHGIPHTEWDSNCITPGTVFMDKLNTYLKNDFIKHVNASYPKIQVVVSGSDEEGEGEHKMIHYIKGLANTNTQPELDLIYGLDADLIMLSLTSHNADIVLMREAQDFGRLGGEQTRVPFKYLLINNLRKSICDVVSPLAETSTTQSIITDYVFICVLLGNDFVPSLSFLKIKDGAVDILLDAYRDTCTDTTIITHDSNSQTYSVNMSALDRFIQRLKEQEDELMQCVVGHFHAIAARPPRNFTNCVNIIKQQNPKLTLREAQEKAVRDFGNDYEEYPLRNKPSYASEIDPKNDLKWRLSYYHYVFGDNSPDTVKRSCENYVDGLFWVINYYFNQRACQEWFCHLHYAPTVHDIHKYMFSIATEDVPKRMTVLKGISHHSNQSPAILGSSERAHLQLLLVLPPQSVNLIPKHLQPVMTDIQHGCIHFYPHEFQVMTYLKHKLWECSPMIPHVDIKKIVKFMVSQNDKNAN